VRQRLVTIRIKKSRAGLVAAALTVVVHVLLLVPLVGGDGQGGVGRSAHGGATLAWIILEPAQPRVLAKQRLPQPQLGAVQANSPAELPASRFEITNGDEIDASESSRTPPFVRRLGELTARIQGAWLVPPGAVNDDFHCRVRIRQDIGGAVRDVTFDACDDNAVLRASLLRAIRTAGPLPALGAAASAADQGVTLEFAAFANLLGGRRTSVEPGAALP
jgi:hypothetical protein